MVVGEIRHQRARVAIADDRSDRDAQVDVLGALSGALLAAAALAVLRAEDTVIAIVDQRIDVAVGDRVYASAAPAVAAIRPAARDVLLAPEVDGPVSALAGVDRDARLIDELNVRRPVSGSPAGLGNVGESANKKALPCR
jgi:hypothetical protein